jgi:PKD repeat protein
VSMTVLEPVAIDAVDWMTDGCQVSFDSTVMGAEPYTYLWDFGDGVGTSIEADPVYTYTAPGGCYTVTLEVSNECGTDTWEGLVCATCEEPPPPYHYIYLPIVIRD